MAVAAEDSSGSEDECLMQTMNGHGDDDFDEDDFMAARPPCPPACNYPIGLAVRVTVEAEVTRLQGPFLEPCEVRHCGQRGVVVRHSGDFTLVRLQPVQAPGEAPGAVVECHSYHRAALIQETPYLAPPSKTGRRRSTTSAAAATAAAAAASAAAAAAAATSNNPGPQCPPSLGSTMVGVSIAGVGLSPPPSLASTAVGDVALPVAMLLVNATGPSPSATAAAAVAPLAATYTAGLGGGAAVGPATIGGGGGGGTNTFPGTAGAVRRTTSGGALTTAAGASTTSPGGAVQQGNSPPSGGLPLVVVGKGLSGSPLRGGSGTAGVSGGGSSSESTTTRKVSLSGRMSQ